MGTWIGTERGTETEIRERDRDRDRNNDGDKETNIDLGMDPDRNLCREVLYPHEICSKGCDSCRNLSRRV
jgi:hypothetical protein